MNVFSYISGFKGEVRKISWTERKELWKLTRIVLLSMFVFGFSVYLVDILFREALLGVMNLLGKIFG